MKTRLAASRLRKGAQMKKGFTWALCACMTIGLLTGCNGKEEGSLSGTNVNTDVNTDVRTDKKAVVTYLRPGTPSAHDGDLMAAINKKLAADKTGLELNIKYIPSDVYQDKVNMMLSSGEEFDLLCIMEDQKPFTSYIASEGIIPITDYVNQSATLKSVIPDYMWESASMGGSIYTIPASWCETADQNNCITIRREKLKEYGINDPRTMDDLLHMCQVFTEKWDGSDKPVVVPMYKEPFTYLFRALPTYPFTVQKDLIYIDQQGRVKDWLETDEFKQCAEFFRTLYENGYVPQDVLSPGWSSWNTMLSGNFIWVDQCQLWDTQRVWQERIPGVDLDTIYLNENAKPFRSNSFRNDTAVSATSKQPDKAVKLMDWVYASQENYDLMIYGVKGLTWNDEGEHLYSKIDPSFEFNPDWMIGNLKYERYQKGTYPKFIEIMGKEKPDAENSVVLNFTFDPTSVADEYANCQAQVVQSIYPIKLGLISYEDGYADALARMKAAGIDKVIKEYQKQYDAFRMATQG